MWRNRFDTSLVHAARLKNCKGIVDVSLLHHARAFLWVFRFPFLRIPLSCQLTFTLLCFALHLSSHEEEFRVAFILSFLDRTRSREDQRKDLANRGCSLFFVVNRSVFTHDYHYYFNERKRVRSLKLNRPTSHHALKHPPIPYYCYYSPPSPSPSHPQPD